MGVGADELWIEIGDDGGRTRSPVNGAGGGHGLIGLRERLRLYGGNLEVGQDGEGFVLTARLPMDAE